jgi:hypothetical protein
VAQVLERGYEGLLAKDPESLLGTLKEWGLLADKDEAHLAIDASALLAARVTSVGFAWLRALPPVHEDRDDLLGFLSSKVLAQKRK